MVDGAPSQATEASVQSQPAIYSHVLGASAAIIVVLGSVFYVVGSISRRFFLLEFGVVGGFSGSVYDLMIIGGLSTLIVVSALCIIYLILRNIVSARDFLNKIYHVAYSNRGSLRSEVDIFALIFLLIMGSIFISLAMSQYKIWNYKENVVGRCVECWRYDMDASFVVGIPIVADDESLLVLVHPRSVIILKRADIRRIGNSGNRSRAGNYVKSLQVKN